MSNRLESLNSKKPGGGKPSLKFKPKAVERKSKEEREKNVKVKQEQEEKTTQQKPPRGLKSTRGRGGRNQYANTHVLSSGLLTSQTASNMSLGKESKIFNSVSPSPEFISNLRLRESTPGKSSESDSDNEGDVTKIDMSKEYKFAEEETVLFPVRPGRVNKEEEEAKQFSKEPSPVKTEPFQKEDTVASENIETELQQILDTKANLESKISQPVDLLNQVESEKLSNDHKQILSLMNDRFNTTSDERFTLIQLPKILPYYTVKNKSKKEKSQGSPTPSEKSPKKRESVSKSAENVPEGPTNTFASKVPMLSGQIGSLNVHKSGKVTLNLGNDINMDMTIGVDSSFLQELVLLNMQDTKVSEPELSKEPESVPEVEPKVKVEKEDDMAIDLEEEESKEKDKSSNDDNEPADAFKGSLHKLGEIDGKLIATPVIL